LLISLAIHMFLIIQLSFFEKKIDSSFRGNTIQVTFRPSTQKENKIISEPQEKKIPIALESITKKGHRLPPPYIDENKLLHLAKDKPGLLLKRQFPQFKLSSKPSLLGPGLSANPVSVKKKVTLPEIGVDKNASPSYMNYYNLVREKIRRTAYQKFTRLDAGEVYVSFIISCDGTLEKVRVNEEKSVSNRYLQEIALSSIKDSSPFPKFPAELDYPQLSFNVVISFEFE